MQIYNNLSQPKELRYTAEEANQKGFYFRINGQSCKIMTYHGTECNIVIPAYINNKPVRQIGTRAFAKKGLKSIVLPDTLRVIRKEAFAHNALVSVTLPSKIHRVEDDAFAYCKQLREVVTKKPYGIDITARAFDQTYYITAKRFIILGQMLLKVNLHGSTRDSFLEIPSGIREIKAAACKCANYAIEEIGIPASVKNIEDEAFVFCYFLKNVLLEKGATTPHIHIGTAAFGSFGSYAASPNSFLWSLRKRHIEGNPYQMNGWITFRKILCIDNNNGCTWNYNQITIYVPISQQSEFWRLLNIHIGDSAFILSLSLSNYRTLFRQAKSFSDKLKMAICLCQTFSHHNTEEWQFITKHIYKAVKLVVANNQTEQLMGIHPTIKLLSSKEGFNPKKLLALTEKYDNEAAIYLKNI